MKIYLRILTNRFKTLTAYKFDFLTQFLFSFLFLFLQVCIWQALYGGDYAKNIGGVGLSSMMAYVMLAGICGNFTRSSTMETLYLSILNGEISNYLLWPMGFIRHQFALSLVNSFVNIVYALPVFIVGVLLFQIKLDVTVIQVIMFIITLLLGLLISFLFGFFMGITTIWLKNSFFLNNFTGILTNLFAGGMVPFWFFPAWLNTLSYALPFRFIFFEPMSLFLGSGSTGFLYIIIVQTVWIAVFYFLSSIIWRKGQQKLLIYGG